MVAIHIVRRRGVESYLVVRTSYGLNMVLWDMLEDLQSSRKIFERLSSRIFQGENMEEFQKWLRVEMLKLKMFNWENGSWRSTWIREDMVKFESFYSIDKLTATLGITVPDFALAVESLATHRSVSEKGFQCILDADKYQFSLVWYEDAIKTWKTDINNHYFEEEGKFFHRLDWIEKIIYLDGTDKIIKPSKYAPREITREEFESVKDDMIRRGAMPKPVTQS